MFCNMNENRLISSSEGTLKLPIKENLAQSDVYCNTVPDLISLIIF